MRILLIILMFGLPILCGAGEVYKWRDKYGNIHYSDVEPDNKQTAKRKIIKASGPKALTEEESKKATDCQRARSNIATLTESEVVRMDLNNDGVAEELSKEQREQQIKSMQAVATANCSQ